MKRIGLPLIFLLSASLLVLMLMITLRVMDIRIPFADLIQPANSVVVTQDIQQTENTRTTNPPLPSETATPEPTATVTDCSTLAESEPRETGVRVVLPGKMVCLTS